MNSNSYPTLAELFNYPMHNLDGEIEQRRFKPNGEWYDLIRTEVHETVDKETLEQFALWANYYDNTCDCIITNENRGGEIWLTGVNNIFMDIETELDLAGLIIPQE